MIMGLRDFFKAKRNQKFASQQSQSENLGLSDEDIARNWVSCKGCGTTTHRSVYESNLLVCQNCSYHGRLSAEDRIKLLVDPDSFREMDASITALDPLNFNDGKPYSERLEQARSKTGQQEALITGTAAMEGVNIVLAVMNFDFIGGSMGSVVGEKFVRAVHKAIELACPFIAVSSSGGARMHEGILSLMQMAKTSIALDELETARLPYISILTDPTFGGVAASFSSLGDIIIAEPKSRIGFAGRRVIEETVREKLPEDFQSAEYLLEHGQVDMVVERKKLRSTIAQILKIHGFFPSKFQIANSVGPLAKKLDKTISEPKKEISLDFEKPLFTIQKQIQELERRAASTEDHDFLDKLNSQYKEVEENIYKNLSPIDITKIARHPNRPNIENYLDMICDRWIELHGDRAGTDDAAMLTAIAEIDGSPCVIVGTRKGRSIKENQVCNFGMPQPEGYRKAKRIFEYANRFSLPVISFIDTPGAYPGLNAESNGQSIAIAENLKALAKLEVPVLAVVTGEGGSGGALAIGVANKILMLENSVYSVISPEGCAAILWRTRDKAPEAAAALKVTAKDLYNLSIIDAIVAEPLGGAHKDWQRTAMNLQEQIVAHLQELKKLDPKTLRQTRLQKYYAFGAFTENSKTLFIGKPNTQTVNKAQ